MYLAPKFLLARHPQVSERAKPTINPGDTFEVVYEARQFPQAVSMSNDGEPANVESAYIRLTSDSIDGFVPIGGVDEFTLPMNIEPSSGTRGSLLTVSVPGSFLVQSGNYKLYVTATFLDGIQVTETRRFRVQDFG